MSSRPASTRRVTWLFEQLMPYPAGWLAAEALYLAAAGAGSPPGRVRSYGADR